MPRHSLLTLFEKSGLFELKIPLICWYFWLQPPASPNTWESGNMKTQCVRMNMQKLEAMQKPSFQHTLLYLSSHIYQVILSLWHQHMGCVYLFKTILSARNYSVSIGTITPFPLLWSCENLCILWSMLFRCWFRCCSSDRSSANCRLKSSCVWRDGGKLGTTCWTTAQSVWQRQMWHVYMFIKVNGCPVLLKHWNKHS